MERRGRPAKYSTAVGERFGLLTVVAVLGRCKGTVEVRCDCGTVRRYHTYRLLGEGRSVCGPKCPLLLDYTTERSAPFSQPRRTFASSQRLLTQVRGAAKARARECTLTVEDIERVRIGKPCHYCEGPIGAFTVGLDRNDNAKGYTPDNIVPCCSMCNDARGHLLTMEEFQAAMAVRIARVGRGHVWDGCEWRSAMRSYTRPQ